MKRNTILFLLILTAWIAGIINIHAQNKPSSKINISSDFVSRYIWRGLDYGKAPSIQPTFSFIKNNFEIGSWGAFNSYCKSAGRKSLFRSWNYFINKLLT